jgi:hypothetical protein
MKRWPTIVAGFVVALKLGAILFGRMSSTGIVPLQWLVFADLPPMWAAELVTGLLFDQRRIWPTSMEALAFDGVLLFCTAIEWYLYGAVLIWLIARVKKDRKAINAT